MSVRLSSPRFRRRLLRVSITVIVLTATVAFFVFSPQHHGTGVPTVSPGPVDMTPLGDATTTTTAADPDYERLRGEAETHASDVSRRLLTALLAHRGLAEAYTLVGSKLLGGTTRAEWIAGKHLPLKTRPGAGPAGRAVAYSGPSSAGIVNAYSAASGGPNYLYAVRVELVDGRWVATYLHEGHAAPFVDETTYAPPGFLPGSAVTGLWWWLSIPAFFVVLIAIVVVIERRISKGGIQA